MDKHCNNCNTLSKDEALKCCVHEDCPHKEGVETISADVLTAPADDLTLGVQAEEENENKSFIGKIADFVTGK